MFVSQSSIIRSNLFAKLRVGLVECSALKNVFIQGGSLKMLIHYEKFFGSL